MRRTRKHLPRNLGRRRGMTALEVVLTTGVVFPTLVMIAIVAISVCRVIYSIIGSMVGTPLM